MKSYRLAILTTTINPSTIRALVAAAQTEAKQRKAKITSIVKVLGCLDMPIIAQALFEQDDVDGLVVLGAVAQGETDHDEVVVETMTTSIVQLSLQYHKPVSFGVIGPGAKRNQFAARTTEYGKRAVQAVIKNLDLLDNK